MEKDKISIVIPTYNRGKLITKCIDSVLKQTYKNIEIIVVDDGSTDNTESVIKKIKDERIKYIKLNENKGACNARNIGIKESSGKYISFQDSDDIFRKDKLEKQYENLKKSNSNFDFCKIQIHDNEKLIEVPSLEQEKSIKDNNFINELCKGNFISTQAILIEKKYALKYMFDETIPRLQDFDFVLRTIPYLKISYTNEILVDLFRQKDSISNNLDKLKDAIFIIINKDYKLLPKQKIKLNNYLLKDYSEIVKFQLENNNQYNNLLNSYNDLQFKYNKLLDEYNNINKLYDNIINSKRWKIINKILKIIKK